MKKTARLILVLALSCLMVGNAQADLDDGLVAHYPFCGNANDESGNGNHGTVNGPVLTKDRFGGVDSAYSFIDGPDVIHLRPEAITKKPQGWFQARGFFLVPKFHLFRTEATIERGMLTY